MPCAAVRFSSVDCAVCVSLSRSSFHDDNNNILYYQKWFRAILLYSPLILPSHILLFSMFFPSSSSFAFLLVVPSFLYCGMFRAYFLLFIYSYFLFYNVFLSLKVSFIVSTCLFISYHLRPFESDGSLTAGKLTAQSTVKNTHCSSPWANFVVELFQALKALTVTAATVTSITFFCFLVPGALVCLSVHFFSFATQKCSCFTLCHWRHQKEWFGRSCLSKDAIDTSPCCVVL